MPWKGNSSAGLRRAKWKQRIGRRRCGLIAGVAHDVAVIELDVPERRATDHLKVMRRHQNSSARGADVFEELKDAARRSLVEVARGLVGDEQKRIVDQRP